MIRNRLLSSDAEHISMFEGEQFICEGGFGTVFAVNLRSDENRHRYALKLMNISVVAQMGQVYESVKCERMILEIVESCEFFVRMVLAFRTDTHIGIVMDYLPNGDLYNRMFDVIKLTENDARICAAELSLAIGILHTNRIIHRDLKLANILISGTGHLVLTDFGVSRIFTGNELPVTYTLVGTPDYCAPEMMDTEMCGYSYSVDWWALGVIIHELITGDALFGKTGLNQDEVRNRIISGKVNYPTDRMSPSTIHFIQDLLKVNSKERLGSREDCEEVQKHHFFDKLDWDAFKQRNNAPVQAFIKPLSFDPTTIEGVVKKSFSLKSDRITEDPVEFENMFNGFDYVNEEWFGLNKQKSLVRSIPNLFPIPLGLITQDRIEGFDDKYEIEIKNGYFEERDYYTIRRCTLTNSTAKNPAQLAVKIVNTGLWQGSSYNEQDVWALFCKRFSATTVKLIDVYAQNDYLFLVHEHFHRSNLFYYVLDNLPFTEKSVIDVFRPMVLALKTLHSKLITHGNVCPRSFAVITKQNSKVVNVKLADFSRTIIHDFETHTDKLLGFHDTIQLAEAMARDQRRLGIILFVLLTGEVPDLASPTLLCGCKCSKDHSSTSQDARYLALRLMFAKWNTLVDLGNLLVRSCWLSGEEDERSQDIVLETPVVLRRNGLAKIHERIDRCADNLTRLESEKIRLCCVEGLDWITDLIERDSKGSLVKSAKNDRQLYGALVSSDDSKWFREISARTTSCRKRPGNKLGCHDSKPIGCL